MNKLLLYLLILPFFFFLLTSFCYAYPDGWSDDILLTPEDSEPRVTPDVDVDGYNNAWVVWDSATWINGTGEILYSKRDSLGNCLIPESVVSNNPSFSTLPRIAVDSSNNIHIIWRDETPQGIGIWYAKLANDGSVIVPSHLAVSGAGGTGGSGLPELALNRNKETNIIWDEHPSGYNQMDYTKLDSLGDTLIAKIRVSPENIYAYWPGIGTDSFANNHCAYRTDSGGTSDRLTYSKLDKDGGFLVNNKVLTSGGLPTLISDQNQNIHVIYSDPTGPGNRVEYLKLDNDGNILIGPNQVSPSQYSCTYCHMAIDSLQYLHVVWQADSSADVHIMYAKLDTMGNFIIPPMKIVYPYQGIMPRIAVDRSNRLHVVWVDGRLYPGGDIFYKRGENEPGVEETAECSLPDALCLEVYPNPFTEKINIKLQIPSTKSQTNPNFQATLKIYDINGRLVKSFNHLTNSPSNQMIWSGTDDKGNHLPAGVYFLRIVSSRTTQTIPVIMLR
jgi:hypothetical protein